LEICVPNKVLSSALAYPIVGGGASAGGLEAFKKLFKHMPKDPGMAFVLLTHLAPEHTSILPQLIQKSTDLKVHVITENINV